MTDEEKEALEILNNTEWDGFMITIKNLIEKQSKEIEHQKEKRENQKKELAILNAKQVEFNKLVNTVNSYKGQFKKQSKEIEELKLKIGDEKTFIQLGECIGEKKVKDKIKAKIEKLENEKEKYFEKQVIQHEIEVLQSLLEKGK